MSHTSSVEVMKDHSVSDYDKNIPIIKMNKPKKQQLLEDPNCTIIDRKYAVININDIVRLAMKEYYINPDETTACTTFLTVEIPRLKGRGYYFHESQRTFTKSLVSEVVDDYVYDPETDIVLYVCALAFRRNITNYSNFSAWYYQSDHATVRFRENVGDLPVFIHSSLDETHEANIPLTTDSATHLASRRIQAAGLNIHGTLYSFRRNFAHTINDNLSVTTAAILMGHPAESMTLKKSYSGQFPLLDTVRLVQTGEITNVETVDPLLNPNAFLIRDIKRFYLTAVEMQVGVG